MLSVNMNLTQYQENFMEIVSGKLNLKHKGDNDWKLIIYGMDFNIPSNSSFRVNVLELVNYTC